MKRKATRKTDSRTQASDLTQQHVSYAVLFLLFGALIWGMTAFGKGSEGTLPLRLIGDVPLPSPRNPSELAMDIMKIKGSSARMRNLTICNPNKVTANMTGMLNFGDNSIKLFHVCKARRSGTVTMIGKQRTRKAIIKGEWKNNSLGSTFKGQLELVRANRTKRVPIKLKSLTPPRK